MLPGSPAPYAAPFAPAARQHAASVLASGRMHTVPGVNRPRGGPSAPAWARSCPPPALPPSTFHHPTPFPLIPASSPLGIIIITTHHASSNPPPHRPPPAQSTHRRNHNLDHHPACGFRFPGHRSYHETQTLSGVSPAFNDEASWPMLRTPQLEADFKTRHMQASKQEGGPGRGARGCGGAGVGLAGGRWWSWRRRWWPKSQSHTGALHASSPPLASLDHTRTTVPLPILPRPHVCPPPPHTYPPPRPPLPLFPLHIFPPSPPPSLANR